MRRWKIAAVVGLIVVGLGALAWTYRLDLTIQIARLNMPKGEATRPVTWSQGPASPAAAGSARPPNIVVILADDLGYNDITAFGGGVAGGLVPTPNIDSIARSGVTFANGYAGNATCAPSRAAMLTGRYATRFGFEFTPTPVAFSRVVGSFRAPGGVHPPIFVRDKVSQTPSNPDVLAVPASEITVAELLRGRGYHTVHLGKWHLGGVKGQRPEDQGFDESLGFMAGASMFLPANHPEVVNSRQDFDPIDRFLWGVQPFTVQFNGGPFFAPERYMTDYLTDNAVQVVRANRNRPFFLYLAYNAPHTPLQATREDYDALSAIKDHRLRVYGAMIRNLDRNIGRVLAELRAQGLDDNTLVVFTSDNGGAHYIALPEVNRPYRGWKATFFEGGIHVPFFMRWPAGLPAGARFERPVGHVDIFSTALGAAGVTPPADRQVDGANLVPFVHGTAPGDPHRALYWRSGEYRTVLADGWKLQVSQQPRRTWLFHLATDPTERTDLAASRPDKVAELQKVLAELDGQMVPPMWPSLLKAPVPIDKVLGQQQTPQDEYIYWSN